MSIIASLTLLELKHLKEDIEAFQVGAAAACLSCLCQRPRRVPPPLARSLALHLESAGAPARLCSSYEPRVTLLLLPLPYPPSAGAGQARRAARRLLDGCVCGRGEGALRAAEAGGH